MPLARKAVTLSRCQVSRSSRTSTATLVSNGGVRASFTTPSSGRPRAPVLYVPDMEPQPSVRAWSPAVPGVAEVLHAHFPKHAYPLHTHDTWTLLVVDTGAVRFDLERHEHAALRSRVTLLPPYVPHDGRSVTVDGFRKRVVYLDPDTLDVGRIGRAVDHPGWDDPALRAELHHLHEALRLPGEEFEAEGRLALVTSRLAAHLDELAEAPAHRDPGLATRLRELL